MKKGFFTSSELIKSKKLPPRMTVTFPPVEKAGGVKQNPQSTSKLMQFVMDIECYANYFLVKFMEVSTGRCYEFEKMKGKPLDIEGLKTFIKKKEIITFNGNKYDIPMLRLALENASNEALKKASDELIKNELAVWRFEEKHNLPEFKIKHIDLIELCIGQVSLKLYGGRLHCDKMQDLPIEPDAVLTREDIFAIREYCENDLNVTRLLLFDKYPQIELRRIMSVKYGMDLLSKSDAQIAETVIKAAYETDDKKLSKPNIDEDDFFYQVPDYIKFKNHRLLKALEIVATKPFTIDGSGRPKMPKELSDLSVKIGHTTYNMGMGGLHSTEKSAYHVATEETLLFDWDVASYYPAIILNCGLYPPSLGRGFLKIFGNIVTERLEAKRSGDKITADSLKLTINGSFGKFGSPYSFLYAPELMVQTTVTGQLSLLMLIENLEEMGIPVVSANTDGIVVKCPKDEEDTMRIIIKRWEKRTGFEMEESKYSGIYSRDVNNYIAIKPNGEVKLKGCFAPPSLAKNPDNEICTIAMIEYLKYGTSFEKTIRECKDISKFVSIRTVNGGAVKNGEYLGKAVRFYHALGERGSIEYRENGNSVANTEGAKPIMDLRVPFPTDVDYDWYITTCSNLFGK